MTNLVQHPFASRVLRASAVLTQIVLAVLALRSAISTATANSMLRSPTREPMTWFPSCRAVAREH